MGLPPSLSGLSQATNMQSLLTFVTRAFFGSLGTSGDENKGQVSFTLKKLERRHNFFLPERNIPNGNLANIFGDVRGSEMPNRFSARTRKTYSCPGTSFPILQEVFVTEANAVTQSPRLTSHFSTM